MGFGCDQARVDAGLCLASRALEFSGDGVIVTDLSANIIEANPAFCAMTGYDRAELLGRNPRVMKSDRHDAEFYRRMWDAILATGQWQGEIWDRRKNGEVFPKRLTINAVRDASGKITHYVGVSSDISRMKREASEMERLAHFDPLTGLPNRILLLDRLRQAMAQAKRAERMVAVLFLDLDGFKRVNDRLGHALGDQLLVAVGERLGSCLRAADTVCRLGGDEFVVVLPEVNGASDVVPVARKILEASAAPFTLRDRDASITTSIGVALYPHDGETTEALVAAADSAMYRAKEAGRNTYRFYSKEMHEQAVALAQLESDLRGALDRGEFVLHYQPRVDLRSGRVRGVEALIRWRQPQGALVPPSKFIPMAEELKLIVPIGEWVLEEAFRQARAWDAAGVPPLRVSVNLAAEHLEQPGLAHRIAAVLMRTGLEPSRAEIEVTETSAMRRPDKTIETLLEMKAIGLRVSIDDFGTGYSSLGYLRRFPIDALKIDRSFIRDLSDDPGAATITRGIIALGHNLGLEIVAEGVETRAQLAFLREHGCDEVQGFLTGRPVPPEAIPDVADGRRLPIVG